jgi:hypothetical protein
MNRSAFCLLAVLAVSPVLSFAGDAGPQTAPSADIASLPAIHELPDPFLFSDGSRVKSPDEWARRSKEIVQLALRYEYGQPPTDIPPVKGTVQTKTTDPATKATVVDLALQVGRDGKLTVPVVLSLPAGGGPFPVIVTGDLCWGRIKPDIAAAIVGRGYALAEFDRTNFAPDSKDRTRGIYVLDPDTDCGGLAAWAWGYGRVIDYLITLPELDGTKIIISGHSRGGKAVLLAGALDSRVALTNPNGSGCGGAGCFRVLGPKAQDLKDIVTRFPYWFAPHFSDFIGHVDQLPFDQHELRAAVAPRALLTTDSLDDHGANPIGTQQSYLASKVVFDYLGAGDKIGLHYRHGPHAHNLEDWTALLDFADEHLRGLPARQKFDVLPFPDQLNAFSWTAPAK